jgi:photosystem II stability/assembly factor-like uncharacterized protein
MLQLKLIGGLMSRQGLKILIIILLITCNAKIIYPQKFDVTDLKCPGGKPTTIYIDKSSDDVYAGCWGGLWKYSPLDNAWVEVDADPDSSILANVKVTTMLLTTSGVFYVGADDRTPSYVSRDGGIKWRPIVSDILSNQKINCIAEGKNGNVYFGTNDGMYKTTDDGANWKKIKGIKYSVNDIFMNNEGDLFAAVANGLYKSPGNDSSWARIELPGLGVTPMCIERIDTNVILVGANGNFYRSLDDGINWSSLKESFANTAWPNPVIHTIIAYNHSVYILVGFGPSFWRSVDNITTWQYLGYATSELNNPNFIILSVDSKGTFYGASERYGAVMLKESTVNVASETKIPTEYSLSQNYPNPFNPTTTIQYSIPIEGHVSLKVYDMIGREVNTLVDEYKNAGIYNSQFSIDNSQLSSGVYFYRLQCGNFSETKKLVLMK